MSEIETLTAEEREKAYRFLAGLCLKPPLDSLIAMIREGSILSVIPEDSEGYTEMERFVKNEAAKIPNIKDEMEAEHTALFVLPSGVLPHEAVYLDKERKLGGKVTISVRHFYEKAGLIVDEKCIEMPDHLGMELEFMGHLCKIERDLWDGSESIALQKCIYFQKTFLDEHLQKWVYTCCEKIIEKSKYSFYKAIAYWIIEFIKKEEEYITELYTNICSNREEICESVI